MVRWEIRERRVIKVTLVNPDKEDSLGKWSVIKIIILMTTNNHEINTMIGVAWNERRKWNHRKNREARRRGEITISKSNF
jgi:hypothetical protein